jgi:flagellar biosynthesis protein FlhA
VLGWLLKGEVALALGVIGIVVLLILPVPPILLDLLLASSLLTSVLILMTSLLIRRPLDFTSFPTVLLVVTLYRLGLNVASTRLILSHGQDGTHGAGSIIEAFGQLMMQGNFIIGVIVFAILVIVNFVVITKGSGRIAEVAARFTLDSMPGKQMAIDADLSSGLIDTDTAKLRRKELEQESTFFGAMDGASKFVRGDAVAGLIITAINIVGGLLIGVIQHKMPIGQAASTYTILTIGALIPGMPIIPFAGIAMAAGALAWRRSQDLKRPEPIKVEAVSEAEEEPISVSLAMDDVKIELGYGLLSLINDLEGRRLTDQIRALRKTLASEYGFVMPPVRILDNMRLASQGYAIRIKEMEAGAGEVRLGQLMAMDPRGGQVELPGEHIREPAFGLPATWISEELREEATFRSYTIVDPATVLTTHLTELLKENMPDLLSYAEVQKLLKDLPADQKKLVEDLVPSVVTATTVQRVLQSLLKERVSIRDLPTILEGIAEAAPHTASVQSLVEQVRTRLARQLCWANRGEDGALPIVTMGAEWEQAFGDALIGPGEDKQLALAPSRLQEFIKNVREAFERAALAGDAAVLLTSPQIRPYVRSIIERFRGQTVVMSQNEIHPKARLRTVGMV